ncbi:hypothetical protein R5R35_000442 [Gryllus longicercus]|uniref:BHLH domain-containing protein n=1 Tax=Gryllus longicercus TaxID=2509291 RepID=A0AAN9VUI0_9ORTH
MTQRGEQLPAAAAAALPSCMFSDGPPAAAAWAVAAAVQPAAGAAAASTGACGGGHPGRRGGAGAGVGTGAGPGAGAGGPCRHVPHREKPPQLVARRNARERRRVQAVNCAFGRLRRAVPIENARGKRVSKVKTLQSAIEYIQQLQKLLRQTALHPSNQFPASPDPNKENSTEVSNRWGNYDQNSGPDSLVQLLSEFQDF